MKFLRDSIALVSAAELAEAIGIDLETVNNWLRRSIITRAPVGGRQLRNRLFATEEVYKAALTNELVKLGIPPSQASDAINAVWKQWDKKDVGEGKKVYAVLMPTRAKWDVMLCCQRESGGPLHKLGKLTTSKPEEVAVPKHAFAVVPLSDVFVRVTEKLTELVGKAKGA